ncbi:33532_t:CDS:10, partial [Racocetra persica]
PPPESYTCKKCNIAGHWIKDCPQGSQNKKRQQNKPKPIPKDYVCHSCKEVGKHFIFDCPNYQCKGCGEKGHHPRDCPTFLQAKQNRQVYAPRSPPTPPNLQACWFCLSNPKTVRHLIASVGTEVYLALAKGSLIDTQDPTASIVPGGGHVILVSIMHYSTFREAPLDDQINLTAEMEKYKSSLKRFFQECGAGMVSFEVSYFSRKQLHYHVQIVPVPFEHDSEKIRNAFLEEANSDQIKIHQVQGSSTIVPVNYFKVDLPDGSSLIHEIATNEQFDVQFGRKVLGKLLGSPQRVNWRECVISDELERADTEKFKEAFKKYDPMANEHEINISLRDECKAKEQELRASLQELDLLTFHNQRLTKRIENLQDSSAAKSSPGWLVGSAKKELERTKALLESTSGELTKEIERNESLHKELFEAKSLYTQHSNVLGSKILELERKAEELQNELTRSHLASEDAMSTSRQEKSELDNELEQTRSELL